MWPVVKLSAIIGWNILSNRNDVISTNEWSQIYNRSHVLQPDLHLNLFSKKKFQRFRGLFDVFLISSFNLREKCTILMVDTFYYVKEAPKSQKKSKNIKEQELLTNWTLEGAQHQKNKEWWIRHKCPYLINM